MESFFFRVVSAQWLASIVQQPRLLDLAKVLRTKKKAEMEIGAMIKEMKNILNDVVKSYNMLRSV